MYPPSFPVHRVPKDINGGVPVNVQNQTYPPFVSYFSEYVGDFSLAVDTGESGQEPPDLVYTFEAVAGHNLSIDDSILLFDAAANRNLFAKVISVDTNTIEIDRPIDHVFTTSTICKIINSDLRVDGSVTPRVFFITAGSTPIDVIGFNLTVLCASEPTDELFGSIPALTRGIVFRMYNSCNRILGIMKANRDGREVGGDLTYTDKAGGTNWAVDIRIPVIDVWGVALRISSGSFLQTIIQDKLDVAGIVAVYASVYGHEVEGEI